MLRARPIRSMPVNDSGFAQLLDLRACIREPGAALLRATSLYIASMVFPSSSAGRFTRRDAFVGAPMPLINTITAPQRTYWRRHRYLCNSCDAGCRDFRFHLECFCSGAEIDREIT